MNQNEIRRLLLDFLREEGITQLHICNKTGIPTYILSRFKNGTKDLYEEDITKLYDFLINHK